MFPLIYTQPAAAGLFLCTCLLWLVPEMLVVRSRMGKASRRTGSLQDRGSLLVLLGLQWIGLALNFLLAWQLPAAAIHWLPAAPLIAGEISILLGIGLRWYAIWVLGAYFTRDVVVSADQVVVQNGPYRLIRHPAYAGTFVTMLGVGLVVANWASLLCLLLCVFSGHIYRVHVEEQALVRALGQPYLEYMRRTKRFIPHIY